MKYLLVILVFLSLNVGANIYTQTLVVQVPIRKLNLPEPQFKFILPLKTWNDITKKMSSEIDNYSSIVVFKSPVKHTAFFCRMEDLTQKKFGVMIQVHVGDYNSYMDYKVDQ